MEVPAAPSWEAPVCSPGGGIGSWRYICLMEAVVHTPVFDVFSLPRWGTFCYYFSSRDACILLLSLPVLST
jgi:hypothetical protein